MPSMPLDRLLKPTNDGISLTVKVSPKSHHDAVKGIVELPYGRLALILRVSPPAAGGAANEAAVDLLAKVFKVSRGCVEIKSGATSRIKTVGIRGNPFVLQARLNEVCEFRWSARR